MTLRKVFWGTFAVLILSAGFCYYAVFLSPIAVNWVLGRALAGSGITFDPAIGDLSTGLMIPTLKKTGEDYDLAIDNVKFKYSAVMELVLDKKFKVDSYTIDRIDLDIKKAELASIFTGEEAKPGSTPKAVPGRKIFTDFSFLNSVEVSEFQIVNFHVRYPIPSMPVKKARISGFELTPQTLSFTDAEFKSDDTDVLIAGLTIQDGEIKKIGNMVGTLRSSYAPNKMKRDVDYVVKYIGGKGTKGFGIDFTGFNGKIHATLNTKDPVTLVLRDFNYSEYFKESFPISALNAEMKAANILFFMTGVIEAKGNFKIGEIPFKVVERDPNQIKSPDQISASAQRGVEALGEKGNQKFKITFLVDRFMSEAQKVVLTKVQQDRKPASLGLPENGVGLLADFPVLSFESNLTKSAQDNFSFLYYALPYAELDQTQKTRVDQEMWIFDKSFPPAPKLVRKIMKPAPMVRRPASIQNRPVAPVKQDSPASPSRAPRRGR